MATEADPIEFSWYSIVDKGQRFMVEAVDLEHELVEIQYFDGELDELEFDEWYQLDLEPTEPPVNWSGPIDIGEQDDLGTEITDTLPEDWKPPLEEIKPSLLESQDEDEEDYLQEEPFDSPL